jgi:hypothetical protein
MPGHLDAAATNLTSRRRSAPFGANEAQLQGDHVEIAGLGEATDLVLGHWTVVLP